MKIVLKNVINGASTGIAPELIDIEHIWTQSRITINGLSTGVLTVRARAFGSDHLEPVAGGVAQLQSQSTVIIGSINGDGIRLDQIELTVSSALPYSYQIMQL